MKTNNVLVYLPATAIVLVALFPFYWLFVTSLRPLESLFQYPPKLYPDLNPVYYIEYIKSSHILLWLWNSFLVSTVATVCSTLAAIPAGYSLSRIRQRYKGAFVFFVLFTQMLPSVLLAIPIYIIFARFRLTDTLRGLMIIYTALTIPIGIWFLKGFFDSVPRELDECATIDGCGRVRILTDVLIPNVIPGIIATATWSYIVAWDEFLLAYILIESNRLWVASVGLAGYVGQYSTPWNHIMMGSVLTTLPVVLLFMYFQKYLVGGLTAGAIKG